jgi:hypothetical protein
MLHVVTTTREEIVQTHHPVTFVHQAGAKVRAYKASSATH